jgi:NitT/TauT family transport system substrate-binding protein
MIFIKSRMGLSRPAFLCLTPLMERNNGRPHSRVQRAVRLLMAALPAFAGCGDAAREARSQEDGRIAVVLQTDWFPQPEHGGFYQALARGFYAEAGLDVTILPGGPNSMSVQKVLKGGAHFAMNRADTVYQLATRNVPIVMVMATLQHDPQAILLHADSPVRSLADLDGRRVMAVPGLAWIRWLEARYGIRMDIIPHDFGMERFISDPDFIQQCLLTNEPFYMRQAGVAVKVLPLRESGFDPCHGIYCLDQFAREHPDTVARFVAASVRGWRDFILGDPAPGFALIAARNPKMTPEFMAFSHATLRDQALVTGSEPGGSLVGWLDPARMAAMAREMRELRLVEPDSAPAHDWYTTRFLLKPGDEPSDALP